MTNSFMRLIIETQEATQSIQELSAEYIALKNRYNPIVWFFLSLFYVL